MKVARSAAAWPEQDSQLVAEEGCVPKSERRAHAWEVQENSARECVAIDASPMLAPLMRCVGACGRCEELMAKYLAAASARERARQEYEAVNPIKAAEAAQRDGSHVPTGDFEDDA